MIIFCGIILALNVIAVLGWLYVLISNWNDPKSSVWYKVLK